jgi:hypothetical protein
MKFVKANLDWIICAAVVLVCLGACYIFAGWYNEEATKAQNDLTRGQTAMSLIGNFEILPGQPQLKGVTIEQPMIDAKKKALEHMAKQAEAVGQAVAEKNRSGRVLVVKGPKGTPDHYIPLLGGTIKQDNFLPKIQPGADKFAFKAAYENLFPEFIQRLGGGVPPTLAEVTAEVARVTADRAAEARRGGATPFGQGAPTGQGGLSVKDTIEIRRGEVVKRMSALKMYVDENALQKRPWFGQPVAPNETQMFEALVDTWLEQDVINAIVAVNNRALENADKDKKNVSSSAIKRLEAIVVGSAAMSGQHGGANQGGGPLFMPLPSVAGGAAATPAAGTLDYTRSMTGHVSTPDYDVVMMKVILHLDPAAENEFINELYKQNNGYTVINRNMRTIDPLDAAGQGFLYGPSQVVRVELLVESLLFRSWTVPLMPDQIRLPLGIPAYVPPAAPKP